MKKHFQLLGLASLLFLASCKKNDDKPKQNEFNLMFYALAEGNRLDAFMLKQQEERLSTVTITGLQTDEKILAIDFRPATGQLYGLGSTSRLYTINPTNGTARPVGMAAFTPTLSGNIAAFDFNPTVDRIRVVTSTGQNLRLHPETGVVAATDGTINGVTGAAVTSAAYTNNFAGATTTTLFDIDVTTDKLYRQDPPNNGTLVEVGSLGENLEGEGGFDIATNVDGMSGDVGVAVYRVNQKSALFLIDLTTGGAKRVQKFEKDAVYYSIAVPTNPVAYSVGSGMSGQSLQIFNPTSSSTFITKPITGIESGESIVGIDFRPATGALYAVGSNSRLYIINTASGAASFVAALTANSLPLSLNGTSFGVDFNPVPDRLRIISNTGQNLRVNPADGVTLVDGTINPTPAAITAAAYTNNFAGTATTTLFVIDSDRDQLFVQNPPNNGTLTDGKSLGRNVEAMNGFDIGGASNKGYGIFTSANSTAVYEVNLMTGATTSLGSFNSSVTGFAIGLGF